MVTRTDATTDDHRAVVIDDDDAVRRSLQLLLHWRGWEVHSFSNVSELLASNDVAQAELLICDYRMPSGSGIEVRQALLDRGWSGRSLLITGYPDDDLEHQAWECGFDAILEKPLRPHVLIEALTE